MKAEPLKGKEKYTAKVFQGIDHSVNFVSKTVYNKLKTHDSDRLFKRDDIRSAVAWLKSELLPNMAICDLEKLIDKAFEDVIKEQP